MNNNKLAKRDRDYIAIHFSRCEIKRLEKAAKLRGMNIEEYIRSATLKSYNVPQLPRI